MSAPRKTQPPPPIGADSVLADSVLIDTHCHLDFPDYQAELTAVLERARLAGVAEIVTVGIDLATSRRAVALAEKTALAAPAAALSGAAGGAGAAPSRPATLRIHATVGVHPHHVNELVAGDYERLRELASHPRVVAYGEIGLDYVKEYSPAPLQRSHFAAQVELAQELGLPLVIHDREAHADTLAILRAAGSLASGGVMHCFSGDVALAEEVLELGFYISIPGVVTFKTAETMREAVARVPLERLLLETDGPFLAPVPYRGKRNEPAFLPWIAAKVAEIKGCSIDEVAQATTTNARRLFSLPPAAGAAK